MGNEKIKVAPGNRIERVAKNQTPKESDQKRTVQSGTFSSMSKDDKLKFIKHDLRAALYVLELVLGDQETLERVLKSITADEAKAKQAAEARAKVNAQ